MARAFIAHLVSSALDPATNRPLNTASTLPQLMLALAKTAGHSGRALSTTYETIPYLLHRSPSCSWRLNVVMRQQDRIDDDHQRERCDHEEVEHDCSHQIVGRDHKEVIVQEKEGDRGFSVCFSVSYSITARFAASGRGPQHFGEGPSNR